MSPHFSSKVLLSSIHRSLGIAIVCRLGTKMLHPEMTGGWVEETTVKSAFNAEEIPGAPSGINDGGTGASVRIDVV